MGPPVLKSPVTGSGIAAEPFYIHSDDSAGFFRDIHGRTLLLRGINLTSNAKTPTGQPGQKLQGFWEGAESGNVSFVNRVLDLDIPQDQEGSVDEHLRRLKSWGFNTLRYVTTWESIAHKGPGQYDQEYIDYTIRVLRKCKEYGFLVYMDPHQDLWSRFSGGSGAPYWTLLACGLNPRNFTVTNAAVLQCEWPDPSNADPEQFPDMIWASNYTRLAVMTIMTLFFAGKHYAPLCLINGVNIQDYLQSHFLAAYRRLGQAIQAAGDLYDVCVIGWDSINEPNHGLVGVEDVAVLPASVLLRIGPMPSAFQAMKLGMGYATEVESWKFGPLGAKKERIISIDPLGKKAWIDEGADVENAARYGWKRSPQWKVGQCIWALHGVWNPDTQKILKSDYFSSKKGEIEYGRDFWKPHWLEWAKMVREVHPEAIHFVQPPVFEVPPALNDHAAKDRIKQRAAMSNHFYDGLTLVTKHWNWFNADALGHLRGKYANLGLAIRIGERAIRKCMRDQLGYLRQDVFDTMGAFPSMMGEIGIPYDLDKRQSYTSGDYKHQSHAMDASLNACDGTNLFNYTMWTYNTENTHRWGENWNGEDLSVWSLDDRRLRMAGVSGLSELRGSSANNSSAALLSTPADVSIDFDLNAGTRAIEAFVRPYPTAIAGMPISVDFNVKTSRLVLILEIHPENLRAGSEKLPTEIYLPTVHYGATSQDDAPDADAHMVEGIHGLSESLNSQKNPRIPHLGGAATQGRSTLSLNVKVSRGYWEVEGSTLRWYHGQESSGKSNRLSIEITRKGGPRREVATAYGVRRPNIVQSIWDSLCSSSTCMIS